MWIEAPYAAINKNATVNLEGSCRDEFSTTLVDEHFGENIEVQLELLSLLPSPDQRNDETERHAQAQTHTAHTRHTTHDTPTHGNVFSQNNHHHHHHHHNNNNNNNNNNNKIAIVVVQLRRHYAIRDHGHFFLTDPPFLCIIVQFSSFYPFFVLSWRPWCI